MNDTKTLVPVFPVNRETSSFSLLLLSGMFFLGSLLGCFWGRSFGFVDLKDLFSGFSVFSFSGLSFLWFFYLGAFPCILCILFSSSLIGPFVLPVLFLLRGFGISAGCMVLLSSGADIMLSISIMVSAALFATVSFFLMGEECFRCSVLLLDIGRGRCAHVFPLISFRRVIFSCVFLAVSAAVRLYMLPRLL